MLQFINFDKYFGFSGTLKILQGSNLSLVGYLCLLFFVNGDCMASGGDEYFKIYFDDNAYKENKNVVIRGTLSTFVKCGSQYAVWRQFPDSISYTIKNLDSGTVYSSINMELSISESGDDIYDEYNETPCDKIVSQDFLIDLSDLFFQIPSQIEVKHFEVFAEYLNFKSNILFLDGVSVNLNKF